MYTLCTYLQHTLKQWCLKTHTCSKGSVFDLKRNNASFLQASVLDDTVRCPHLVRMTAAAKPQCFLWSWQSGCICETENKYLISLWGQPFSENTRNFPESWWEFLDRFNSARKLDCLLWPAQRRPCYFVWLNQRTTFQFGSDSIMSWFVIQKLGLNQDGYTQCKS